MCRRQEDLKRQEELFERYVSALETEIRTRRDEIDRVSALNGAGTLYIGGGTPSVLPLQFFERLVTALGHSGYREFTVEVNPEDVVEKGVDYIKGLVRLGVNRISMGLQSFDDGILKWMNRRHTASQAREAYHILEASGIENISIDLIFGLPRLTETLWRDTLDQALHISASAKLPPHISAYQLSVEEGSMLEKMLAKGMCTEASDEVCRSQYDILCETLGAVGYHHYEVSNFAQPGFEAVHNSAYWNHVPYIGLGPGAHSFVPRLSSAVAISDNPAESPFRSWNEGDLKKYLHAAVNADFAQIRGGEVLTAEQIDMEKIMLGLRTSCGVDRAFLQRCCQEDILKAALADGRLTETSDGRLRIPESLFFVSDAIILDLVCQTSF